MEAIITIVGFLGVGKTTLLKHLISNYINDGWSPFVILNDYENANLDAAQLTNKIDPKWIKTHTGSCVSCIGSCCGGIHELRNYINCIPERDRGITIIEANGTSDACSLMEFLGVGLEDRFLPPIQISVVDLKNWQKREEHNELEINQIQVSSLIVITHLDKVVESRKLFVIDALKKLNPYAKIITMDEVDVSLLPELEPSKNTGKKLENIKVKWASCSTDLPNLPNTNCIYTICNALPKSILRVKGCTQIGKESDYTYFERKPDGEVVVRSFTGEPITGPKLLTIGPNSDPELLKKVIKESLTN